MANGIVSRNRGAERRLKHEAITADLRRRILDGELPVGARLPSVLDISTSYGVSAVTALKGVQGLVRERLVVSHLGAKGTIVVRNTPCEPAVKRNVLACLFRTRRPRNDIDNFAWDMLEGVHQQIALREHRMVHHSTHAPDVEAAMAETVREPWVAGMVLDQTVPVDLTRRLDALGVPGVSLNTELRLEHIGAVTPDYYRAGREGARRLIEKGYRRLATYEYVKPGASISPLTAGFRDAARAAGVPHERLIAIADVAPKDPVTNVPEQFGLPRRKDGAWEPLGIATTGDTRARQLLDVIEKTDLVVGRDIGVIGCFDLDCNLRSGRPISTWRIDPRAIGAEAVEELLARIADPSRAPAIVKLSMEFMDRGSF